MRPQLEGTQWGLKVIRYKYCVNLFSVTLHTHVIMDYLTWDVFHNDSHWFPVDIHGRQFGFKDMYTRPDVNVFIPRFRDLHWSIVFGLILVICRYFLDK